MLPSLRTTNMQRFPTEVESSGSKLATYTPEVAVAGIVHDADTAQLSQWTRPVTVSTTGSGCDCGSATDGLIVAISRAPFPAYQPTR